MKEEKTLYVFNSNGKVGVISDDNVKVLPAVFHDIIIDKNNIHLNIKGNYLIYNLKIGQFVK